MDSFNESARLPDELTRRNQWLPHKAKVPHSPITLRPTDKTDPESWTGLERARSANLDGIGFVLTEDDPLFCVDLDGVRNPDTGEIDPDVLDIVNGLDTYTEVSPSGTGLHIWGIGTKPGPKTKRDGIEIYDRKKFITVTGQHLEGTPLTVNSRQLTLEGLYYRTFEPADRTVELTQIPPATGLSDEQVIANASTAKNGDKFRRLFFEGDCSGYASPSEADGALAMLTGFYTGGDIDQIERIMRRSKLVRDKWDRPGTKSYLRDEIIVPALLELEETYQPKPDELSQLSPSLSMLGTVGTPARSLQAESFYGKGRPEPRRWVVKNLVPAGYPTILYGEGGKAKSQLAAHMGISRAAGVEDWLGHELSQLSLATKGQGQSPAVVYLDFELDRDTQLGRAYDLAAGMGLDEPPERFYYVEASGYTLQEAFQTALEACMDTGADLLILDSIEHAMMGDSESINDVRGFIRSYVEPFKVAGIATLVIDHQSKMIKGERYGDKTPFGSAFKGWAARSVIQVNGSWTADGSALTATLTHTKSNFGPKLFPFSARLTFRPGRIEIVPAGLIEPERPDTAEDKIMAELRKGPGYAADIAKETDLSVKTVKNYIGELKKQGVIRPTGNKRRNAEEIELVPDLSLTVLTGGLGTEDAA